MLISLENKELLLEIKSGYIGYVVWTWHFTSRDCNDIVEITKDDCINLQTMPIVLAIAPKLKLSSDFSATDLATAAAAAS